MTISLYKVGDGKGNLAPAKLSLLYSTSKQKFATNVHKVFLDLEFSVELL